MSGNVDDRGQSAFPVRSFQAVADELRRLGYEIEPARPGAPPGSELIARRDQGTRAILVAVDRSGRLRAEITWLVGEWPSRVELGETALRTIDRVTREVTVTGQLTNTEMVLDVVAELGKIVPWAGETDEAFPPPTSP